MVNFDDCPALFEEGLIEALEESRRGLCCDPNDAFARALGRSEYHTVTVHAAGIGICRLRLLGLQGDVLRAINPDTGALTLIPLCLVYAFYEGALLPSVGGDGPMLHMDGGSGCCGRNGLAPELERLIGKRAVLQMPQAHADILITEVIGLTLTAVSGGTILYLRIDCIDLLELKPDPET